jgi:hypothetical protein
LDLVRVWQHLHGGLIGIDRVKRRFEAGTELHLLGQID